MQVMRGKCVQEAFRIGSTILALLGKRSTYVEAKSGQTLEIHNPTDGSLVASNVHVAGEADVDDAVAAATKAFKEGHWSQLNGAKRADLLNKFADLFEKNIDEIVHLESLAMGIPVGGAKMFASAIPAYFRYYAGYADKIEGDVYPPEDGSYNFVQYEPLGVVACISAWNATYLYYAWKIAPALAAGNTVIFKTSEKSPLGGLFVGKLFAEAGFPPGVVNFVTGGGATGHLLAAHPKIRMISFTGSTNAGRKVQEAAAKSNLKKVSLELGGKSPAIVFEDADLQNAVPNPRIGADPPPAASRLYVHESISTKLIAVLKESFEAISQGLGSSPLDPKTFIGPVADSAQFETIMRYIEEGKKSAKLITGGNQKGDKGYFIEPTIFVDPSPDSKVLREEIFGPVLVIQTFKTEEEVIELANDTEYGLSGEQSFPPETLNIFPATRVVILNNQSQAHQTNPEKIMDHKALMQQALDDTKDTQISFLQSFVRAPSPNPPGHTAAAAAVITNFLASKGIPYELIEPQPGQPNIVSSFQGGLGPGPRVVLNGHIDVFPVASDTQDNWDRDPWSGAIENNRIHGRGVVDMKSGTASLVVAYTHLYANRQYLKGSVSLCAVSDEETGGQWGTKYILQQDRERWGGDVMLSAEPAGCKTIRFSEKGTLRVTVTLRTRGGHGAYLNLSKGAIRTATGFVADVIGAVEGMVVDTPQDLIDQVSKEEVRELIDETMGAGTSEIILRPTVNVGTIKGGVKVNMIPDTCVVELDIRMPVGLLKEEVLDLIHQSIIPKYAPEATIEVDMHQAASNPFSYSSPNHPMVGLLADNAESLASNVTGEGALRPLAIPSMGATDCKHYRYAGVPAFVYGCSPLTSEYSPIFPGFGLIC
ncbi:hypothetical protein EIK77_001261 [Talaromyces pinophilus]|nr:hypothetical protein EIK77_001261 [Talaromyces pinophilus]